MINILYCVLHGSVHPDRYNNVINSWGKDQNLLFYSDTEDPDKNIVKVTDRTDYHSNEEKNVNVFKRIFSDDIDWCKKNLNLKDKVFVEGENQVIDMFLMSNCGSHIIANSSFSWWAAYLSKRKTICPKKWFVNEKMNEIVAQDLILPDWKII